MVFFGKRFVAGSDNLLAYLELFLKRRLSLLESARSSLIECPLKATTRRQDH